MVWLGCWNFYNIFAFLLFPQQYNTFTMVPSQNILDQATKTSRFRPPPIKFLLIRASDNFSLRNNFLNFSLLILVLGFGMEKQTRVNKERAWASWGHLDRKFIWVVTFFLLRVMCLLLLECNSLHLALSLPSPSSETPKTENSSCSFKNSQQRDWALLATLSWNYLGHTAVVLWNRATPSVKWGFQIDCLPAGMLCNWS